MCLALLEVRRWVGWSSVDSTTCDRRQKPHRSFPTTTASRPLKELDGTHSKGKSTQFSYQQPIVINKYVIGRRCAGLRPMGPPMSPSRPGDSNKCLFGCQLSVTFNMHCYSVDCYLLQEQPPPAPNPQQQQQPPATSTHAPEVQRPPATPGAANSGAAGASSQVSSQASSSEGPEALAHERR